MNISDQITLGRIQKPSKKQIESIVESDARINIWEGAVRAGKSFSCLLRWIEFILKGPEGEMMICGRTEDSIVRNIIRPMQRLVGSDMVYMPGKREVRLWNKIIYVVGANDERAAWKIQGSTLVGALVDEITILPESFFKMLLSRLSVPGAKLFGTTNPDSPFHWFKKQYLDRLEYPHLKVFKFLIDDNPSLEKLFVDNLKKEYVGLWYERYIEGKWVLSEGTVYDFFSREQHIIPSPPGRADWYIVGVDYGTSNPTVYTMIGYSSKTFPNIWLEKEYYWDSRKEMKQKVDTEYVEDLKKFVDGYNVKYIYIDPSAVSIRIELYRYGFRGIMEANNDVLDGIRFHAKFLNNGTFKICAGCVNSIHEYATYRWDQKASLRGEDKPLKENDHCMDSIRYALYTHFKDGEGSRMSAEDLDMVRAQAYGIEQHGRFFDSTWSQMGTL